MLSRARFGHAQFGVLATMPVDDQDDLARLLVDVNHDVLHQGSQQLLTSSRRHSGCVPSGVEIIGQAAEVGRRGVGLRSLQAGELALAGLHPLQSSLPALLQLRSDQPVVWVAGGVTPFGKRRVVAGLLQLQLTNAVLLGLGLHEGKFGLACGIDRQGLDSTQKLARHRLIGP